MSPIFLVCVLLFGTLFAYPHMYTIPCPITQSLSPPYSPSPPTTSHSHNYNPYPMKIIVNYPQNNAGQIPSCGDSPNSDNLSPRGDLGTVTSVLKLPGVLADKLISGEISLK